MPLPSATHEHNERIFAPNGIEVSIEMCAAGAAAYREWEVDFYERGKLNAVANLVAKVYRTMEAQRRRES